MIEVTKLKDTIYNIFQQNIKLLAVVDRSVIYLREGEIGKALIEMTGLPDAINAMASAIILEREYFRLVSTESVEEMLGGILEAKKQRDYVLLADLLEVQLGSFICSVQELIMKQEDYFAFDEEDYFANLGRLDRCISDSLVSICGYDESDDEKERLRVNHSAALHEALDPQGLLEAGYAVELTSCGLMTVALNDTENNRIYLHSNGHTLGESFILAGKWFCEGVSTYIVYGLGMGYHISELAALAKSSQIVVYEDDIDLLRLFCAFSGNTDILSNPNIHFVYDPDLVFLPDKLGQFSG